MSEQNEPRERWPVWLVLLLTVAVMLCMTSCAVALLFPMGGPGAS